MADKSIGFIETFGLAACVAAADAAVKSANVKLLGFEYAKGGGMCTVKVEGNVGACKAAVEAGKKAAESVQGSLSGTKSVLLKARPAPSMRKLLVDNRETVGGEIALAEGYRPKGDTKKPVLVKNWKPKAEPKAETPMEEAPEPPVVEEPENHTSDENMVTDFADHQPEETPKTEETKSEEVPEEEVKPEEAPRNAEEAVDAPKAEEAKPEEPESVEAPEPPVVEEPENHTSDENMVTDSADHQPEETPKTEETKSEEVPEEEVKPEEAPQAAEESEDAPKAEEVKPEEPESVKAPEAEEAPVEDPEEAPKEETPAEEKKADDVTKTDAPARKPSTGNRRSGRSRKKKNTDKNTDK